MRSLRTGLSLTVLVTCLVTLFFTAPAAHAADTPLRDLAAAKGKVMGTAVTGWHSQNPSWLTNGNWTSAELSRLMTDHIATEVGRYKGRLATWDVVNEPFNEDGTYRQTLWYNGLGADCIAQALTAARAADSDAKSYISEPKGGAQRSSVR